MNDRPTWTNTQQVIAYALVISFILVIFVWMLMPPRGGVDQSVLAVVNMLMGALVAKFTTVIDFFFGSSQGSKDKDDAQNKMIGTLTGTGNGSSAAMTAAAKQAAEIAAPPAAAVVAPPAASEVAPSAAEAAAPAAAEKAVADALKKERDQ